MGKSGQSALAQEYDKAVAEADSLGLDIAFAHFRTRYHVVTMNDGFRLPIPKITKSVERYYRSGMEWEPGPRGGGTRCRLFDDGTVVAEHYEKCSLDEAFCYQKGRTVALGKAVKGLQGGAM